MHCSVAFILFFQSSLTCALLHHSYHKINRFSYKPKYIDEYRNHALNKVDNKNDLFERRCRNLIPLRNINSNNPIDSERTNNEAPTSLDFDSLLDMDIILFKSKKDATSEQQQKLQIGAMSENGRVVPLSAWTLDSPYLNIDCVEFVVDEEDLFPGFTKDDLVIHSIIDENLISYGSRQLFGGKGPGNPHGEESELVYYVDRGVLESNGVDIVIKPELEILW